MLNLARRLADDGLTRGRAAPVDDVRSGHAAERAGDAWRSASARSSACDERPMPAFRVEMSFSRAADDVVGDRHRRGRPRGKPARPPHGARVAGPRGALAVPRNVQVDLLEASAVVPSRKAAHRRAARRATPAPPSRGRRPLQPRSAGRRPAGRRRRHRDRRRARLSRPSPARPDLAPYLRPEPFIESDAPEIRAEADARGRAASPAHAHGRSALTRYVNALLDKKPTVSLPSAREVLRTKVGDCNEHTALFVAMARAVGIPARIAVGLVSVRNAFYYHAWPEVYIDEGARPRALAPGRSHVQPVSGRRHARAARARRTRQAGRHPSADRPREDDDLDLEALAILVGRPLARLGCRRRRRDGAGALPGDHR